MLRRAGIFLAIISGAPTSVMAAQMVTVNVDTIGCLDPRNTARGGLLADEGDMVAFQRMFGPLLKSSDCVVFKRGTRVYLEGESTTTHLDCVREPGEPRCYAVQRKAIDR